MPASRIFAPGELAWQRPALDFKREDTDGVGLVVVMHVVHHYVINLVLVVGFHVAFFELRKGF